MYWFLAVGFRRRESSNTESYSWKGNCRGWKMWRLSNDKWAQNSASGDYAERWKRARERERERESLTESKRADCDAGQICKPIKRVQWATHINAIMNVHRGRRERGTDFMGASGSQLGDDAAGWLAYAPPCSSALRSFLFIFSSFSFVFCFFLNAILLRSWRCPRALAGTGQQRSQKLRSIGTLCRVNACSPFSFFCSCAFSLHTLPSIWTESPISMRIWIFSVSSFHSSGRHSRT